MSNFVNTPKKHAEIIKAWADGETIEYSRSNPGNWQEWNYDSDEKSSPLGGGSEYRWRVKTKPLTGWLNVFSDRDITWTTLHPTRVCADGVRRDGGRDRIACIQVSYTEGEGLE